MATKKTAGTKKEAEGTPAPKKRGRPAKEKVVPEFVQALGTNAAVVTVALSNIDLADTTFRFRQVLRVADLVASLEANGQKVPAILREVKGRNKYQIISGFRRITAIAKIGWDKVNAIVLDNVSDDEAWKISVIENEARKTYSDLDRGYAIRQYVDMGHTVEEVATTVFHLSRKQATRLKSLVDLPKAVQEAIGEKGFTATHALVLKQLADRFGDRVDYKTWIDKVGSEELSVSQLRSAILAAVREEAKGAPIVVFVKRKNKATGAETIRLRPVKIDPSTLSAKQRSQLVKDLKTVLAAIEK